MGSLSWHVPQPPGHLSEQNPIPPFGRHPCLLPLPHGHPRAVASFVEVGVQPQLPGLLQGPGKNGGWGQSGAIREAGSPGLPRRKGGSPSSPEREAGRRPGGGTCASRAHCHCLHHGGPPQLGAPPYLMMSCKALSSGFSWYWMPCLAHRDFTRGATLWKLCRGMVGKRLGRMWGAV